MLNLPLISVIVPVYNAEKTIKKCLEQLTNQTYTHTEIIVIDDGSTDNSASICKEFDVTLLTQSHSGAGIARNLGIKNSSGTYLFFADADDYLEIDALSCMVSSMDNTDLLVFGYKQNDKDFTYSPTTLSALEVKRTYFSKKEQKVKGSIWNKCFKATIIKENHIEFPSIARNEEEIFLMKYLDVIDKISLIPDILYHFYPIDMQKAYVRLPKNFGDLVVEFKNECINYSKKWNDAPKEDLEAISREFYGKMILSLKLCLNPANKDVKAFKYYANLMLQELPTESDALRQIRMYKLLKGHHYFIAKLLLSRYKIQREETHPLASYILMME